MKLNRISKLQGIIRCLSGLHIGGSEAEMHIGGIDNCVIKHPLTQQPYVPGSSLKGKMRSLLEWRSGAVRAEPLTWADYEKTGSPDVLHILQLFGSGASEKSDQAILALGPSRLAFWDCMLSTKWLDEVDASNTLLTEVKTENTIDRISGTSNGGLRHMERVPADATFVFTLTIKELEGDEDELFKTVLAGLKLLELDSLGGSGSRGYGKIRFENMTLDGKSIDAEFAKIDPFASK